MLTSCAESFDYEACMPEKQYTFLNGLWHGFISPVTFIISLFKDNVEVYACNNNGNWYTFGFLFGASIIFGGGSKASCGKR